MSKRRHNFGTKRFKEKSLFVFHARIALKLLFVRLIARGARIGRTHTQTHRQNKYCNPRVCALRVNNRMDRYIALRFKGLGALKVNMSHIGNLILKMST